MKLLNPSLIAAFATGAVSATATFGPVCLKLDGLCDANRNQLPSCRQPADAVTKATPKTCWYTVQDRIERDDQNETQKQMQWHDGFAGEKRDEASAVHDGPTGSSRGAQR